MNKIMKLVQILMIAIMIFAFTTSPVFAEEIKASDIEANTTNSNVTDIKEKAGKVLGLVRNISVIAGVLLIAFMGLKFMLGSAEEKAEYKKSFVPLIVGIVVVMSATSIASLLFTTLG